MRKITVVMLMVLTAGICFAQVVAVAPFEARAGISAGDAEVIAEVYSIRLSATRAVRVVTREALDRVVREHQFQEGDWSDNNKTAALGGALNADWIVRGTLQKLGNRMIITVTLLDIKTLEVKAGADMRINDVDDAYDRMDELVAQTVAAITGGSPAAPIQTGPGGGGTDTYKVGDRGPTGGHIFYDKGVYINGWRYLEAAPVETEFTAAWGAYNNNVSGTAVALGTGKRNTQFIVDYLRGTRETGTGAQLSASLNFDGHSDWFLPSKDELNLMYVNLKQKGLGDFQDTWYLSSSQDDDYVSVFWLQHFGHGQQGYEGKPPMSSVRAVRAF